MLMLATAVDRHLVEADQVQFKVPEMFPWTWPVLVVALLVILAVVLLILRIRRRRGPASTP